VLSDKSKKCRWVADIVGWSPCFSNHRGTGASPALHRRRARAMTPRCYCGVDELLFWVEECLVAKSYASCLDVDPE